MVTLTENNFFFHTNIYYFCNPSFVTLITFTFMFCEEHLELEMTNKPVPVGIVRTCFRFDGKFSH